MGGLAPEKDDVNAAGPVDRRLRLNASAGQAADRNRRPMQSIRARGSAYCRGTDHQCDDLRRSHRTSVWLTQARLTVRNRATISATSSAATTTIHTTPQTIMSPLIIRPLIMPPICPDI